MGLLSLVWRRRRRVGTNAPAAAAEQPAADTVTPRPAPGRLGRVVADVLRMILIPTLVIAVPLWFMLVALTPIPVFCVVALPLLLLDTLVVSYSVVWLVYLALAQTDPPPSATPPGRNWLRRLVDGLVNATPLLPYRPSRVITITWYTLQCAIQVVRVFFPAIFDWSYRRVMVLGTQSGSEIVMENIVYSDDGKMLDTYLPPSTPDPEHQAPILVILPTSFPLIPSASGRKTYLQLALRFRRQGYAVVVPELTFYPSGRIESGVSDVRNVLSWIGTEATTFSGDPNRIYLLGHGLSAHLALLTCVQHAVVHSREKFLDAAWERELQSHESLVEDHGSDMSPQSPPSETDKLGSFVFPATTTGLSPATRSLSTTTSGYATNSPSHIDTHHPLQEELRTTSKKRTVGGSPIDDASRWMDDESINGSIEPNDPLAGPSGVGQLPPGLVSGRELPSGLPLGTDSESLPCTPYLTIQVPPTFAEAEEQIGMGLKSVQLYSADVSIPPVRGVILMAGISDVIKAYRYERERGLEAISPLRRSMGPSHTKCLLHSPAHLLYAAKNILDTTLLPPKFLLITGGNDSVVPVEQSTLLRTMLQGLGVDQVTLRAYRNLGHVESLAAGFLGMGKSMTRYRDNILADILKFVEGDDPSVLSLGASVVNL